MTADFNGDGKTDIATVRGTAVVTITLGVGNGDFRPRDLPFDLGPGVVFQGLVAAADFNGDHIPDLLAITQSAPGNWGGVVLLGIGDGSFRTPILLGPADVRAVADFNRDGKLDLLVAVVDIGGPPGFAVRLGNGDGTFQPPGPLTREPVEFLTWAAVADFNGDGKLDLVETSLRVTDSKSVYLWLGNGDGTFGSVMVTALGSSAFTSSQLVAGDFNGDRHADLAVLVNSPFAPKQYSVQILLGDGTGNFRVGGTYAVPVPAPLIAADFEHSGRPDLAAGFAILPGNGDGTFGMAQSFGQYAPPNNELGSLVLAPPGGIKWVAAGDINGDGKLDLVGPSGNNELSVLINNTPGRDASANAVSAANYSPLVAPGSIASVFGSGLASTIAQANGPPWPTSLANTSVQVEDANGVAREAQLLYVSPTQINFVIPPATAPGFAVFNVYVSGAQPPLNPGAAFTMVQPLAPAFFTLNGAGQGPPAATAVRVQADGSQTPVPVAQCSAAGACTLIPIDVTSGNVYLTLYGTGFLQATAANCVFPSGSPVLNGNQVPVTYFGPQPAIPGLDQLNLRLPGNMPSGTQAIQCRFDMPPVDNGISVNFNIAIQ